MSATPDEESERGRVRIYAAADAPELYDTDFNTGSDFSEQPELADLGRRLGAAGGAQTRLLVRQTPEEGGFSLLHLWFKPHFPLFRHRHEDECMYVVLSGSAVMGNRTLRPGDSFYVGSYAPYSYTAGPDGVEVLEIRKDAEGFTTIFAKNTDGRIEEAERTLAEHAPAWKDMTVSPLEAANRGDDPAS